MVSYVLYISFDQNIGVWIEKSYSYIIIMTNFNGQLLENYKCHDIPNKWFEN